jgi:hypothetical protein
MLASHWTGGSGPVISTLREIQISPHFSQVVCDSCWPVSMHAARTRVQRGRVAQASACVILVYAQSEKRTD